MKSIAQKDVLHRTLSAHTLLWYASVVLFAGLKSAINLPRSKRMYMRQPAIAAFAESGMVTRDPGTFEFIACAA